MNSPSTSLADPVVDFVAIDVPDNERQWVPQAERVWLRPLLTDATAGSWMNQLLVRSTSVLRRHRRPALAHVYVIQDTRLFLEYDWTALQEDYVFKPLRKFQTLVSEDEPQ